MSWDGHPGRVIVTVNTLLLRWGDAARASLDPGWVRGAAVLPRLSRHWHSLAEG